MSGNKRRWRRELPQRDDDDFWAFIKKVEAAAAQDDSARQPRRCPNEETRMGPERCVICNTKLATSEAELCSECDIAVDHFRGNSELARKAWHYVMKSAVGA